MTSGIVMQRPELLALLVFASAVSGLVYPPVQVLPPTTAAFAATTRSLSTTLQPPGWISSSSPFWLGSTDSNRQVEVFLQDALLDPSVYQSWKKDVVTRVVDANTLRLEKTGQVTLAAVQMPSAVNYRFPDCFDKEPSYQLRKFLPVGTVVRIKVVPTNSGATTTAVLVVKENAGSGTGSLVNAALIQAGFAKVRGGSSAKAADEVLPGLVVALHGLSRLAQEDHLGIYQSCDDNDSRRTSLAPMADFEPLDGAVQATQSIPPNPGNRFNCADFQYFEEAFSYYDRFYPYYGDVARLDRDNDGVPCPGLPHTLNQGLYRMKVPQALRQ